MFVQQGFDGLPGNIGLKGIPGEQGETGVPVSDVKNNCMYTMTCSTCRVQKV